MSGREHIPDDDEPPDDEMEPDDIEASLNDALSDLERMLGQQEPRGDKPTQPSAQEQYTIPLLDEVVIPGPGVSTPGSHAGDDDAVPGDGFATLDDDEPALRRRLAARLASEIEVLVYDRVEQAIEQAKDDIREQVRNHLDIILPEIVEEILQQRHRRGS